MSQTVLQHATARGVAPATTLPPPVASALLELAAEASAAGLPQKGPDPVSESSPSGERGGGSLVWRGICG